jgi:hypothetical protein
VEESSEDEAGSFREFEYRFVLFRSVIHQHVNLSNLHHRRKLIPVRGFIGAVPQGRSMELAANRKTPQNQ